MSDPLPRVPSPKWAKLAIAEGKGKWCTSFDCQEANQLGVVVVDKRCVADFQKHCKSKGLMLDRVGVLSPGSDEAKNWAELAETATVLPSFLLHKPGHPVQNVTFQKTWCENMAVILFCKPVSFEELLNTVVVQQDTPSQSASISNSKSYTNVSVPDQEGLSITTWPWSIGNLNPETQHIITVASGHLCIPYDTKNIKTISKGEPKVVISTWNQALSSNELVAFLKQNREYQEFFQQFFSDLHREHGERVYDSQRSKEQRRLDGIARLIVADETAAAVTKRGTKLFVATNKDNHPADSFMINREAIYASRVSIISKELRLTIRTTMALDNGQTILSSSVDSEPVYFTRQDHQEYFPCLVEVLDCATGVAAKCQFLYSTTGVICRFQLSDGAYFIQYHKKGDKSHWTLLNALSVELGTIVHKGSLHWSFRNWRSAPVATPPPGLSTGCLPVGSHFEAPKFLLRLTESYDGVTVWTIKHKQNCTGSCECSCTMVNLKTDQASVELSLAPNILVPAVKPGHPIKGGTLRPPIPSVFVPHNNLRRRLQNLVVYMKQVATFVAPQNLYHNWLQILRDAAIPAIVEWYKNSVDFAQPGPSSPTPEGHLHRDVYNPLNEFIEAVHARLGQGLDLQAGQIPTVEQVKTFMTSLPNALRSGTISGPIYLIEESSQKLKRLRRYFIDLIKLHLWVQEETRLCTDFAQELLRHGETASPQKLILVTDTSGPKVHAEMRLLEESLLLYTEKRLIPYIGSSKLCCTLCRLFLSSMGVPNSGTHATAYPGWHIPEFFQEPQILEGILSEKFKGFVTPNRLNCVAAILINFPKLGTAHLEDLGIQKRRIEAPDRELDLADDSDDDV